MKKQTNEFLVRLSVDGELMDDHLHQFTCDKYKADNPFFYGAVPYLLMVLCMTIDFFFFQSLFQRISYDNQTMLFMEVIGLLFAADLVPVYAGVVAKRVRQGLSREKFILGLLLAVPIFALVMNVLLRVATAALMSPDGTVDAATKALSLISMVVPIFTSVGGFAISYSCYSPLEIQMNRQEMAIETQKDICRRLEGILGDYEADPDFVQRLNEIDEGQYQETLKLQRAKAVTYCDYVRQRIKEYLANPTSNNALSKDECNTILDRLDAELAALDRLPKDNLRMRNALDSASDVA